LPRQAPPDTAEVCGAVETQRCRRAIYRKLGVSSRAAALERGRELGLL
jgi:hypothetical protein